MDENRRLRNRRLWLFCLWLCCLPVILLEGKIIALLGGLALGFVLLKKSLRPTSWGYLGATVLVISLIVPVDISFRNYPGSPHFVKVVYGLPGKQLSDAAKRKEVILGGCVVNPPPFDVQYLLVW